jgi:alkanesulfonate monooxygenase SsuD/methylene tetrahydromethanopterin reductase-like flavin-dependent oxidoreductase (luciferase family)
MQYGLVFPNSGSYSDARLLADLARQAEEAGWGSVFLWDTMHYGNEPGLVNDPWIALAAVAMQTERVKLGPLVTAPPRRRPWKMAREAVTLDHLSNGRLILGVGAGDENDRGFAAFGEELDMKKRARMLDESLEILQGLWSGQPFSYNGEHYHIDNVTFLPAPVQKPGIPIWVGWVWPKKRPMERAARFDGAVPFSIRNGTYASLMPEDIHQLKLYMDEHHTDSPIDIVARGPVFDAARDEPAHAMLQAYAEAGATWCLQNVWPWYDLNEVRASIRQGPPSLE